MINRQNKAWSIVEAADTTIWKP